MASTSASRAGGVAGRIQTAASTLYSDNQSLIAVTFSLPFCFFVFLFFPTSLEVHLVILGILLFVSRINSITLTVLAKQCLALSSAKPKGAVCSAFWKWEIRKALNMMKEIGFDLERDNQSQMVKELESGVVELLASFEDCMHFSSAIHSVGDSYNPGEELTNFKKLFNDEITKFKASSSSVPQNHPMIRQFREAIWNVHHPGEPMPGEEQDDVIMTSTQCNLLNVTCPLSGRPVTELAEPVRSVECKHIYEKDAVMQYIKSKNARAQCPVAGCPKILQAQKVVCDPLLAIEIDEMRAMGKQTVRTDVIEDCTELDEE